MSAARYCRWCGDPLPLRFTAYCRGAKCLKAAHAAAETADELLLIENLIRQRRAKGQIADPACAKCAQPRAGQSRLCVAHQLAHRRAYDRAYQRRRRPVRRCEICHAPLVGSRKKKVCAEHRAWRQRWVKLQWERRQREVRP